LNFLFISIQHSIAFSIFFCTYDLFYFAISMTLIVTHDTRLRSKVFLFLLLDNDCILYIHATWKLALDEYTHFHLELLCFPSHVLDECSLAGSTIPELDAG
jgi:hypothetical protein